MGENRVEQLEEILIRVENIYVQIVAMIKREQFSNALVILANNEGVMSYLNAQKLEDSVADKDEEVL